MKSSVRSPREFCITTLTALANQRILAGRQTARRVSGRFDAP